MKVSTEQNVPGNLPLSSSLTKQQAEQIYEQGKEAVVFALLQPAKMAAEQKPNNLPATIGRIYRLTRLKCYDYDGLNARYMFTKHIRYHWFLHKKDKYFSSYGGIPPAKMNYKFFYAREIKRLLPIKSQFVKISFF